MFEIDVPRSVLFSSSGMMFENSEGGVDGSIGSALFAGRGEITIA